MKNLHRKSLAVIMTTALCTISGLAAVQQAAAATDAQQSITLTGRISDWPGGSGSLLSDEGRNLGTVSADGTLTLTLQGSPDAPLRSLEDSFRCEGATLTSGEAGYQNLGRILGVADASGRRIGRVQAASSEAVARWVLNPQKNSAVPGYGLQFSYATQPASSHGECDTGSETQSRNLNWASGWNIEQVAILAVGKSPFFPTDAPTRTEWKTLQAPPADVAWFFQPLRGAGSASASPSADNPAYEQSDGTVVDRLVRDAGDATEDAVSGEVRNKIFRGVGRLFR